MRTRLPTKLTCLTIGLLLAVPVYPHGGGLNSAGCHSETATGGYHCHNDEDDESLDSDVLIGLLVVSGVVYLVYKWKQRKSRSISTEDVSIEDLLQTARQSRFTFDLSPAENSFGKIDGVKFGMKWRF